MRRKFVAFILGALLLLYLPAIGVAQGVIVLSFLTGPEPDVLLMANAETLVWNFDVYPPASPLFHTGLNVVQGLSTACVEPVDVTRCPDYWSVLLLLTPITLYNDSAKTGNVTMTVYSDNAYVYQQRITVPARAYVPISPGALSLGFIMNSLPTVSMPVRVTLTATERMRVLRDTAQPTSLQPGAPRVWGAVVELRPI